MAGRVVLFVATGYTGRLTAEAMAGRGMKPVLAARNADKLALMADKLGGLETEVADVARPASVAALVEEGDVLVSTVGPFVRWGGPAVEAATAAGANYIDSTGEPAFIRRVFELEGPRAEAAGSALLTALGYDWVPGNLAGALALDRAGEAARKVRIGYFMTGKGAGDGMSGGTRASLAGAMVDPAFAFRKGQLITERGAARVGSFEVRGKSRQGISVGTSEAFTLPRLSPGLRDVEVYLGWFGKMSRGMQAFSLLTSPIGMIGPLHRGVKGLSERYVKGSTGGPDEATRAASGSAIVAEALAEDGTTLAEVHIEGVNGYDFTGRFLAWSAEQMAAGRFQGTGALGPAEAFGLAELEAGAREAGMTVV